jgi:hypothetical protein
MYRVILTKNGEYKMTLHRCKTRDTSFINYHRLIDENKNVFFPRKHINYNGIKPVEYRIYVVKDFEEGDPMRTVRDKMGRTSKEKPIFGIWTVIADNPYEIEESFWMFPRNSKSDRVTIHDIVKPMMEGAYKQMMTKQIIVVHNKLILHNEDQFEMVICKNKLDAQRLHHTLHKACKKNKIKSIIFMGTASPATISRMYELIQEKTGWSIQKIRRTSTRP